MKWLAVIFLLVSCQVHSIQDQGAVKDIKTELAKYRGKYHLHVYDCSNMSYDMAVNLQRLGYDTYIYCYVYGFTGHAIVKIRYRGIDYFTDPARQWAFINPPKGQFIACFKPSEVPAKWLKEFKGHLNK
jgi:hypothetical protein